jgi:hypothetical protein
MADVKISGLPASTTPLDGTEVLPIVQGTTTKQVSITNVTVGRAVGVGSLTLNANTSLYGSAANILAQYNTTSAQSYQIYNTRTDASNYERLSVDWGTAANTATIAVQSAGTGVVRPLSILGNSYIAIQAGVGQATLIGANNNLTSGVLIDGSANFKPYNDNQTTCGLSTNRWKSVATVSLIINNPIATQAVAPTIASAATIAPTAYITFISGTTTINTITAPAPLTSGGGQITLIPTGIFSTGTSGNIALASTAIVGKALIMTYDSTTVKWYPSY